MQEPFGEVVGKRVAEHLYTHIAALACWPEALRVLVERAMALTQLMAGKDFNIVKVHRSSDQLSLLAYDDFDTAPFPTLSKSWRVDLLTEGVVYRDYTQSRNPPILHRKESLLPPADPRVAGWAALTRTAEALGLFGDTSRIGFREQWLEQIALAGYMLEGDDFVPLANVIAPRSDDTVLVDGQVKRHLTALSRSNLSAPVQALWRHELIAAGRSFFDYGCGKGDDVCALVENGIEAKGWDPHFRPDALRCSADTVNLGFVVNVIEDLDERVAALRGAYELTRGVLAVAAMLASQRPPDGRPHRDGYLTSRNTFQKYFSQIQLRDFIEHVLDDAAIAVGPGVFFVFKNKLLEQRFLRRRYGARSYAGRTWLTPVRATRLPKEPKTRLAKPSRAELLVSTHRELLLDLWQTQIRLGRQPFVDELAPVIQGHLEQAPFSLRSAFTTIETCFDQTEVDRAKRQKSDDLIVFAALAQFGKRQPYRALDRALQRDVRHHFGDYSNWQSSARAMLHELTDPERLNAACVTASDHGLGWLENSHSLQLHADLVPRLPALLRIYIGCATMLVGELSAFDLVKVHIRSGKLSLLKFADFTSPIPRLVQRVKVRLRDLDLDIFDYGNEDHPNSLLFWKSRFINEECVQYHEQLAFEAQLLHAGLGEFIDSGPSAEQFDVALMSHRWQIDELALLRSKDVPDLDAKCGHTLTYRDFVECGETQSSTGISNRPRQADTYTALRDLAYFVLDPVIDYFGMIELTYGVCSAELAKAIPGRIAPKLDQHAGHEVTLAGRPICERLGAACDFLVADEDMEEVALWVAANTPFDRLYFYGKDRPIHVSYSATPARQFIRMTMEASGNKIPRIDRAVSVFGETNK
jgi:DNA phosphorothioation-associated putative methyltransferase